MSLLALLFSAALAQPAPASAPMPQSNDAAPSADQQVVRSQGIGGLLYLFDRAAWVSTDALTARVAKDKLGGPGGYVVEMVDGNVLRVTYYRGDAAEAQAFFVADVRDGKVVRSDLLSAPVALTPIQTSLARAREIAAATAQAKSYKPCTSAPFNTVVLPSPNDGPIAVYLLSAQQDAGTYPMGGHYRVVLRPDGTVLASRPYSVQCLNLAVPKLPAGARPAGLFVTHLLDPVPTEIHAFASYALGMPLFVGTPDKRIWSVSRGKISVSDLKR